MSTTDPAEQARHASWTELFFDLVAVAGVGALAHLLVTGLDASSTAATLGLYVVLFLAFWLAWTAFMLYGNVAAGQTHELRLLVGMFGLGVMAASVPGVAHVLLDDAPGARPLRVFAVAYVVVRVLGAKAWGEGQVLVDFPAVQHLVGAVPWLVSVSTPTSATVVLWAVGVAIDVVVVLVVSGEELLAGLLDRVRRHDARSSRRPAPEVSGVSVDPEHLAERLGLFVIIVLGEGVVQVVHAASGADPDGGVLAAGLVSFVLLAGMFGLSVVYGYAGVPHLRAGALAVRAGLALHCLVTGVLAAVAVALAEVVADGRAPLDTAHRWLLCGSVAAYFALGLAASVAGRGFRATPAGVWVLTGLVVPLLLGVLATDLRGTLLALYVALVVVGHLTAEFRAARRGRSAGPAVSPRPGRPGNGAGRRR